MVDRGANQMVQNRHGWCQSKKHQMCNALDPSSSLNGISKKRKSKRDMAVTCTWWYLNVQDIITTITNGKNHDWISTHWMKLAKLVLLNNFLVVYMLSVASSDSAASAATAATQHHQVRKSVIVCGSEIGGIFRCEEGINGRMLLPRRGKVTEKEFLCIRNTLTIFWFNYMYRSKL